MHRITYALRYAALSLLCACATINPAPKPTTPEEAAAAAKPEPDEATMRMGSFVAKDAAGVTRTFASTDNAGTQTPHHIVSDPDGATLQDIVTSDAAMPAGVRGPVLLGQRRDADTTIASADGEAGPVQLGPTGALKVELAGGSGGTSTAA